MWDGAAGGAVSNPAISALVFLVGYPLAALWRRRRFPSDTIRHRLRLVRP
jgi:hypothetical protein